MDRGLLFIDTETTGRFYFDRPDHDPFQPHIVQLAAVLTDPDYNEVAAFHSFVEPEGWHIEAEAQAVHLIREDDCLRYGLPLSQVLGVLGKLLDKTEVVIAHNYKFDSRVISAACQRLNRANFLACKESFCTMLATTDVCRLPGAYGRPKWPKLTEAHQYFFGELAENTHDAMGDVRTCMKIYRALLLQKQKAGVA